MVNSIGVHSWNIKKAPQICGTFFTAKTICYLDFFAVDFFVLEAFFAHEDEAFFVQEDLQHFLESCSTAIDQKYSSCPKGQPAFCQM